MGGAYATVRHRPQSGEEADFAYATVGRCREVERATEGQLERNAPPIGQKA